MAFETIEYIYSIMKKVCHSTIEKKKKWNNRRPIKYTSKRNFSYKSNIDFTSGDTTPILLRWKRSHAKTLVISISLPQTSRDREKERTIAPYIFRVACRHPLPYSWTHINTCTQLAKIRHSLPHNIIIPARPRARAHLQLLERTILAYTLSTGCIMEKQYSHPWTFSKFPRANRA